MKRFLLILAACGGNTNDVPDRNLPPEVDSGPGPESICLTECNCQILTQAGCNSGERCTWVLSTDDIPDAKGLGAISCAPNGDKALGAACTVRKVAMGGYDDCVRGTICIEGTCRDICDPDGGSPSCPSSTACGIHGGIFANVGATTTPAGSCDAECDPLADNDFDGSGTRFTKSGTACGSDPTVGCYGAISATHETTYACSKPYPGTEQLTHRSVVPDNLIAANSCMSGYQVGTQVLDDTGALQTQCLAFCKPGDAYKGNPNANAPNGVAPHRCNTDDALGAFGTAASDTANGEHCWYTWAFEIDDDHHVPSPTGDTVGVCIDHTQYKYDSDGNGTADAVIPPCSSLPLTSPEDQVSATTFGCVNSALATPTSAPRHFVQLPELGRFRNR